MGKMKKYAMSLLLCGLVFACGQRGNEEITDMDGDKGGLLEGDSTIYGLACEGCTDSVVVLLPTDGSDPVTYDIVQATLNRKVHGKMSVGDKIGLVRNPEDTTVADLVIDLEELSGTWCYQVMPQLRSHLELTDSIRKALFVPREYGFRLKRRWTAQSVGYVPPPNPLEDRSPVVYPQLRFFTEWHILNGQLIITSGNLQKKADSNEMEIAGTRNDTCEILYLRDDSLVLGSDGITRGYYRKPTKTDEN